MERPGLLFSGGKDSIVMLRLAETRPGAVAWAAPFVQTVMGTDRYVDELWPS